MERIPPLLTLFVTLCVQLADGIVSEFAVCHDDITLRPLDGIVPRHSFTWLGFIQYIHVTTGLPHHSKSPRVVLVQSQSILCTATDVMHLPKNYKLGNSVFGDYERDEEECGLTNDQVKMGINCPPSYLEMPIGEIVTHPEFSRFGVGNSLAIVKLVRPMKSNYVIPICLPSFDERMIRKKSKSVFMVDYVSTAPRQFDTERMAKKTLKLYTHKECRHHRMKSKLGSEGVTHVLCTSGCGVRPGAPILLHAASGPFELVGLAAGGAPCSRRVMRHRFNVEPPLYIDVYPYNTWIVNVITANLLPMPYPHNFVLTSAGGPRYSVKKGHYLRKRKRQKHGWRARTYVSGNFCFKPMAKQQKARVSQFYVENFLVNADPPAKMNIMLKVNSGLLCTIICVRLMMPNRYVTPVIKGVGAYNISIEFSTRWFPYQFYFSLALIGRNTTQVDLQDWQDECQTPGYCGYD